MTDLLYMPERAIITRGLEAHYGFKLGVGSPTLYDLSPNLRHGTLQNAPAWINEGLDFNGSTQYVTRTSNPASTRLHVCGVARKTSSAATYLLGGRWGANNALRAWIVFSVSGSNAISGDVGTGGTPVIATTSQTVTLNSYFFWEIMFDGTNVSVRLNATGAYSTAALSGNMNNAGTWELCRNNDGAGTYYLGQHAYYLEYSRALSADEIAHIYRTVQAILSQRGIFLP